jgi:hypothetical protein
MPITLINSDLANKNFKKLLSFCVLWGLGQATWGYFANEFENFGRATIHQIQYVNYGWFIINLCFMLAFVKHHNLNATKEFTLDSEKKSSVKED